MPKTGVIMEEFDDEFDEASFEDDNADVSEDVEVTPEEEAFMQGYDEADQIEKDEIESADLKDSEANWAQIDF